MSVPGIHDLTNEITWFVNNTYVEKQMGRFEIDNKDLIIHYVSRLDKNLLVLCKALDDKGVTRMANRTVPVGCKFNFCSYA